MESCIKLGSLKDIKRLRSFNVAMVPDPVRLMYEYGTESELMDHLGYPLIDTAVYGAAAGGRLDVVKRLLDEVHVSEHAALEAAKHGRLEVFKELEKRGLVDYSATLHSAIDGQQVEIVDYLIEHGVSASMGDIKLALNTKNHQLIQRLFTVFPQLFSDCPREVILSGMMVVIESVVSATSNEVERLIQDVAFQKSVFSEGDLPVIKYLYTLGATPPEQIEDNSSLEVIRYHHQEMKIPISPKLIAEASECGNLQVVAYAVEQGVPIPSSSIELALSGGSSRRKLVEYLIEHDAPIEPTAMIYAAGRSSELAIIVIDYLIKVYGLKRVLFNWSYRRAIIEASAKGLYDLVVHMIRLTDEHSELDDDIEYDVISEDDAFDMGLPNSYYDYPLYAAVCNGHLDVAEYLRANGYTRMGIATSTALHGHLPAIVYYITQTTNPDPVVLKSLLDAGAYAGYLDIVEYMLTLEVIPDHTTLSKSIDGENLQIIKLIHQKYKLGMTADELKRVIAKNRFSLVEYIADYVEVSDELIEYARKLHHNAIANYLELKR